MLNTADVGALHAKAMQIAGRRTRLAAHHPSLPLAAALLFRLSVALLPKWDLLLCAKHLFAAAETWQSPTKDRGGDGCVGCRGGATRMTGRPQRSRSSVRHAHSRRQRDGHWPPRRFASTYFLQYETRAFLIWVVIGNWDTAYIHSAFAIPARQRLINATQIA
jgi:hypothetical protein